MSSPLTALWRVLRPTKGTSKPWISNTFNGSITTLHFAEGKCPSQDELLALEPHGYIVIDATINGNIVEIMMIEES